MKEVRGTITDEEKVTLDYLDGLFKQVEQLIIDGNKLEVLVNSKTTIEEIGEL